MRDAKKNLEMVDAEVDWHEQHPPAEGGEDDQMLEVMTVFFNWASERIDQFVVDLEAAKTGFKDLTTQFGEDEIKEPVDFFETLDKFLTRFEAACKDVDDARKEATPKKGLRRGPGRPGGLGGGGLKIKQKGADTARPAAGPGVAAGALPQRRLPSGAAAEGKERRPSMQQRFMATMK